MLPPIPTPPSTINAPEVVDVLAVEAFTLKPVLVTVARTFASPNPPTISFITELVLCE